jgi:hypothetical protein
MKKVTDPYGIPKDVTEVVNESQSVILARLTLSGVSNEAAAKQLGVSKYQIRKLQKSEDFKKHLKDASEDLVSLASNTWKGMMQELIPLAYEALKKALDKGDLKGVELMIKTLGIDKQVAAPQSGNLQIILPDYKTEKLVNVEVKSD